MSDDVFEPFEPVKKINRDIIDAIRNKKMILTKQDIRYLVDVYYQLQERRKAAKSQLRAATESEKPFRFVNWAGDQMFTIEKEIKLALTAWTETDHTSVWARGVFGIGPVISAGLAAHIDIKEAITVGHIWNFGGVNPKSVWLGTKKSKAFMKEHVGKEKLTEEVIKALL